MVVVVVVVVVVVCCLRLLLLLLLWIVVDFCGFLLDAINGVTFFRPPKKSRVIYFTTSEAHLF